MGGERSFDAGEPLIGVGYPLVSGRSSASRTELADHMIARRACARVWFRGDDCGVSFLSSRSQRSGRRLDAPILCARCCGTTKAG